MRKRESRRLHLREIADRYMAAHPDLIAMDKTEAAAWAIKKKYWVLEPKRAISMCAAELQAAMTSYTKTDPKGREQRVWGEIPVVVDLKQRHLWFKLDTAPCEMARAFFNKLMSSWKNDGRLLRNYVDSYNEYQLPAGERKIQLDFTDPLRGFDEEQKAG